MERRDWQLMQGSVLSTRVGSTQSTEYSSARRSRRIVAHSRRLAHALAQVSFPKEQWELTSDDAKDFIRVRRTVRVACFPGGCFAIAIFVHLIIDARTLSRRPSSCQVCLACLTVLVTCAAPVVSLKHASAPDRKAADRGPPVSTATAERLPPGACCACQSKEIAQGRTHCFAGRSV